MVRVPVMAGSVLVGVGDFAVADDVVDDDQGAFAGELERPFEVGGVVGLVGVDEDEVEGLAFSAWSWASESAAGPMRISTMLARPAGRCFPLRYGGVFGTRIPG
jgi:hypothetical protein